MSRHLQTLLSALPLKPDPIDDETANGLVQWYRDFKPLVTTRAKAYASPDNVAEATVPTSIILGCTALGTLVGGPPGAGIGALVGGLITSQVKPGKAAEEILKGDHEN